MSNDLLWTLAAGGVGALCAALAFVVVLAARIIAADDNEWRDL